MAASEAQIRANRLNALKSTGPKTVEGKSRSRANALKHGLCASAVVPEDLEAIQRRAWQCFEGLKPQDEYQSWHVDQVAILSLRVDRCQRIERRARDKVALRAALTWDDDRRAEAKALGGRIGGQPEEVVEGLRRTPQGCDWLIDRWSRLLEVAREAGAWTEEQTRLAFDLLGTPSAFRPGRQPASDPVDLATRQVAELEGRREVVAELDEVERALAEADLTDGSDLELRRLRRYESSIHRRIRWSIAQVRDPSPHKVLRRALGPTWTAEADPAPPPSPKTADELAAEGWSPSMAHPPFDLEPDEFPEPGQVADIPKILESRKAKRLAKAANRREARRRKLDRLRA